MEWLRDKAWQLFCPKPCQQLVHCLSLNLALVFKTFRVPLFLNIIEKIKHSVHIVAKSGHPISELISDLSVINNYYSYKGLDYLNSKSNYLCKQINLLSEYSEWHTKIVFNERWKKKYSGYFFIYFFGIQGT